MKNKHIQYFWIGFSLSAIAAAIIYWLLKTKREIMPAPIIVKKEATKTFTDFPEVNKKAKPDDLSRIRGIGPAYAQRLSDAGIYTFEQLALTSPEDLQQVTGDNRWDPEQWITEASELSIKANTAS